MRESTQMKAIPKRRKEKKMMNTECMNMRNRIKAQ